MHQQIMIVQLKKHPNVASATELVVHLLNVEKKDRPKRTPDQNLKRVNKT